MPAGKLDFRDGHFPGFGFGRVSECLCLVRLGCLHMDAVTDGFSHALAQTAGCTAPRHHKTSDIINISLFISKIVDVLNNSIRKDFRAFTH